MFLKEVDLSGHVNDRILRRMIPRASGKRGHGPAVPAARQVYIGASMGAWTQAAMRGPSAWSVGERKLMAALVAKWNACIYSADVHSTVAAAHLGSVPVGAALSDYDAAPISPGLKATLSSLETMTLRPADVTEGHAGAVLGRGVGGQSLVDAIPVGAVLNLVTRYVDALSFTIPTAERRRRAAEALVQDGYPV